MLASHVFDSVHDLALFVGYFVGSFPTAFLLAKLYGVKDIRIRGSGNVGTTNAGRVCGPVACFITLIVDISKPAIALSVLYGLRGDVIFEQGALDFAISSLGVVIGHCFPIWLGFRGGKGLASNTGFWLVLDPIAAFVGFVVCVLTLLVVRRICFPYFVFVVSVPVFYFFVTAGAEVSKIDFIYLIMLALVLIQHSENIKALLSGKEEKFVLFKR